MAKQAVKKSRRRLKQNLVGWGFVLPSLIVFILFLVCVFFAHEQFSGAFSAMFAKCLDSGTA